MELADLEECKKKAKAAIDTFRARRVCTMFLNRLTGRMCSTTWVNDNTVQQQDGLRTVKFGKNGKKKGCILAFKFDPEDLTIALCGQTASRMRVLLLTAKSNSVTVKGPAPTDLSFLLGAYDGASDDESVETDGSEIAFDEGLGALHAAEAEEHGLPEANVSGDIEHAELSDRGEAAE